ncbi:hypothetical protein L7F22_065637 [Adiantum nelumboides]|nr:hypothetical protein [Adiantum nelumboides]
MMNWVVQVIWKDSGDKDLPGFQGRGLTCQVEEPHTYFTGSLGKMQYIVCRDGQGELHGLHNVCRHHASPVATGSGCTTVLQCPYHGWSYSLDGRFQKATQLAGIQNFKPHDFGLLPISIATWGPFVLLNFSLPFSDLKLDRSAVGRDWLGDAHSVIASADIDAALCHVATKEYLVNCNWKVWILSLQLSVTCPFGCDGSFPHRSREKAT